MKKAVFALLLTLSSLMAHAQDESQTGYNFLRLPVSAHAAALGGDNVSLIEDDETMIFHNPALLSSVTDKTINLNYMSYMSGVNTASASFYRVVKERASWAVSGQYLDYGKMKEMNENNVQTGEFSARDISMAGYFSYMLTNHIAGGISAKLISSFIGDYSSVAFGVDLGLNYFDDKHQWSVSMVAKNLGGQLKAYDKMPLDVQIGVSKAFANVPLRLHLTWVDINHPKYKFINHLVVGADFQLSDQIWIGGGYNFRRANEMKIQSTDGKSSNGAGLSLGGGLNLNRFKLNIAYAKYHVSSSSLLFNVSYVL